MNNKEYKEYQKAVNKRFFIGIIFGAVYVTTLIVWAIIKTI